MSSTDKEITAYVTGPDTDASWIPGVKITHKRHEADLLVITGGVDIHPAIYGCKMGSHCQKPDEERDMKEIRAYFDAIYLGQLVVGICRGAQLICALNGGKLIQHQENPKSVHEVYTFFHGGGIKDTTVKMMVNSAHHQAQYPWGIPKENYQILSYSCGLSKFHLDETDTNIEVKVEVEDVWYPKSKALAIQCHPEWMYNAGDRHSIPAIAESVCHYRNLFRWFRNQHST
jgi:gamma-glutamyl-gamma-aminobutyrate hydrolase PuuD